jgi:hypothetical protein
MELERSSSRGGSENIHEREAEAGGDWCQAINQPWKWHSTEGQHKYASKHLVWQDICWSGCILLGLHP